MGRVSMRAIRMLTCVVASVAAAVAGCAPAVPDAAPTTAAIVSTTGVVPTSSTGVTTTTDAVTVTTAPVVEAGGVTVRGTEQDLSSQVPQYGAIVSYPVVESDEIEEALVAQVNTLVETHVSERVEPVIELMEALGPPRGTDEPSSYRFTYEVAQASTGLLGFRFFEEARLTGSSGPTLSVSTLMIEVAAGVEIRLDDIVSGAEGRTLIADAARTIIVRELYGGEADGFAPFAAGAAPNALEWAVLTPDGLELSFDELSIGPADMGTPTIVVPYDRIPGALDPGGAAAPFLPA